MTQTPRPRRQRRRESASNPGAELLSDNEECRNCGSIGGEPRICTACSTAFCSKCDVTSGCPVCGADLP